MLSGCVFVWASALETVEWMQIGLKLTGLKVREDDGWDGGEVCAEGHDVLLG